MNSVYLDTNIFLYLSDDKSKFFRACVSCLDYCYIADIEVVTSVETLQEIIFYSQRIKELPQGFETIEILKDTVHEVLPINETIIENFVKLMKKYSSVLSRDVLHLAVSIENDIDGIVTYDKEFRKFKELPSFTPEEFLRKNK